MARTTISFTEPNQAWLEAQIASKEFKSASDVVNSVLRQIRRQEQGEQLTDKDKDRIAARMDTHKATYEQLAR